MGFFDLESASESVDLDEALDSLIEGNNDNAVQNPELNTPEPVPTRDIVTATQYKEKLADGSTVQSVASIEGVEWKVVAFNQVLGADDAPRQLDLGLDPSLQQYLRIRNFSLFLQGDGLEYERDTTTGIGNVTGAAQTYPGVTIQPGDHFVGIDENGKKLLMIASDVRELSWKNNTSYEFTVKLFNYAEDRFLNNLDIKSIKTYYYSVEGAICGNPLTDEELQLASEDANGMIIELVDLYYDQFFDKSVQSFAAPYEDHTLVYDGSVSNFFIRLVGSEWRGTHPRAINYTVESKEYRDKVETIWDVLMMGTRIWRNRVNTRYDIRSVEEYRSDYTFNHLSHSHFTNVVAPAKVASVVADGDEASADGFYVFSEGFYDQDNHRVDKFESVLLAAMAGTVPSIKNVYELIEEMQSKDKLKQFYEIPVLIWHLIKITRQV